MRHRDDDDNGPIGCWCGKVSVAPADYDELEAPARDAFWRRAEACEGCRHPAAALSATAQRKGEARA